ncbi:hypothetical protein BV96_03960 [Sphingomonas paucimobilis]|nr:hypothetical protein BV96_03960 [Sphingomonas paucimobilis]
MSSLGSKGVSTCADAGLAPQLWDNLHLTDGFHEQMAAPRATPRPADLQRLAPLALMFAALNALALFLYWRAAFAGEKWAVPNDARQFLSWTARISDPGAMRGNVLADYWQQTAPLFYRALLYASYAVGIEPLVMMKSLGLIVLPASAYFAWRLASAFTADPFARYLASSCVIGAILHIDAVFSGTPRAIAVPLILMTLYAIASERRILAVTGLLLQAVVYPAPAITCLAIYALDMLRWNPPFTLAWDARRVTVLVLTTLAVVTAGLIFKEGLAGWGPALRLDEALHIYSMADFGGRSTIVGADGSVAWLCSRRIGFLPAIVNCRGNDDPRLLLNFAVTIAPIIALAIAYQKRAKQGRLASGAKAWRFFLYTLVAALLCYIFAASIAFSVHLPSRYSQPVLAIMGMLALGLCMAGLLKRALAGSFRVPGIILAMVLALGLIATFATPQTTIVSPRNGDLIALISATPRTTHVAGIEQDLDFVPLLTSRALLASTEHDIPYHRRYHQLNQAGLRASMRMAALDGSPAFRRLLKRHDTDLLIFDRAFLSTGILPQKYRHTMPPPHRIKPSIGKLQAIRAFGCRVVETRRWIAIFTGCFRHGSRSAKFPRFLA